MKKVLLLFITVVSYLCANAQSNVGIGTLTPDPSSVLDLTATDKGLLVPRVTTVQRTAISSPTEGLLVYDTNFGCFYYFKSGVWISLCNAGATGATGATGNSGTAGVTGPTGVTGPVGCNQSNYIIKSNGTAAVCTVAPVFEDNTGNIGIGTITPVSKVDVNGNLTIGSSYSGSNAAPSNGAIIQGQVGVGNNAPDATAILDLTNTNGAGAKPLALKLPNPPNSASTGTPIPPDVPGTPVGGLMVYNQTTGCLQYYNAVAGQWFNVAISTGTGTSTPPSITGCTAVGANQSSVSYSISTPVVGVTYQWSITSSGGGPTLSSTTGTTVSVTWNGTVGTAYTTTLTVIASGTTGTICGATVAGGGRDSIIITAGGKQVFQCNKSSTPPISMTDQTFTTPANSCIANYSVKLWGAGGGCGGANTRNGSGGAGGFVSGLLALASGTSYPVVAGMGGFTANATQEYGGGGTDAGGNSGGSGGGRAAIRNSSNTADLVTAGGGGGAAYANGHSVSNNKMCYGGAGGGLIAVDGGATGQNASGNGRAGTQAAGGVGGTGGSGIGTDGSAYQGGNGGVTNYDGGGGGGGYFGGGGGACDGPNQNRMGGGGGGSSYVVGLSTAYYNDQGNYDSGFTGNAMSPSSNATGDPDYIAYVTNAITSNPTVGQGGGSNGSVHDGGPGLVVIAW